MFFVFFQRISQILRSKPAEINKHDQAAYYLFACVCSARVNEQQKMTKGGSALHKHQIQSKKSTLLLLTCVVLLFCGIARYDRDTIILRCALYWKRCTLQFFFHLFHLQIIPQRETWSIMKKRFQSIYRRLQVSCFYWSGPQKAEFSASIILMPFQDCHIKYCHTTLY